VETGSLDLDALPTQVSKLASGRSAFVLTPISFVYLLVVVSDPPCRRNERAARPITSGKLLGRKKGKAPPSRTQAVQKQRANLCKALYAYSQKETGDLSFNAGDTLEILERDGEWWLAKLSGGSQEGWIPSNYVEEIAAVPAPALPSQRPPV
jgi:hypothetical protein